MAKDPAFEDWLFEVSDIDDEFFHVVYEKYEDERAAFYKYFKSNLTPWQALQKEYELYG